VLSREAGALTISYVLIVPVFLIGIMTVVQASIWYLARDTVLAAARHGADVARTSTPPPGSGAQAAISFATSATSGLISNVTASTRGTTATTVRITVSAQIPSFVPGLAIHVHEVVTAPVERFVALGDPAVGGRAVPARTGLGPSALARPAADPPAGWDGSAGSRPWLVRS
jgi:Flp pilus assembly protein TadG